MFSMVWQDIRVTGAFSSETTQLTHVSIVTRPCLHALFLKFIRRKMTSAVELALRGIKIACALNVTPLSLSKSRPSIMTGYVLFGQLPGVCISFGCFHDLAHFWLSGEVFFPCLPRSSTPILLKRLHIVPLTRHEQQPYASVRFAKRPQVGEFCMAEDEEFYVVDEKNAPSIHQLINERRVVHQLVLEECFR